MVIPCDERGNTCYIHLISISLLKHKIYLSIGLTPLNRNALLLTSMGICSKMPQKVEKCHFTKPNLL